MSSRLIKGGLGERPIKFDLIGNNRFVMLTCLSWGQSLAGRKRGRKVVGKNEGCWCCCGDCRRQEKPAYRRGQGCDGRIRRASGSDRQEYAAAAGTTTGQGSSR